MSIGSALALIVFAGCGDSGGDNGDNSTDGSIDGDGSVLGDGFIPSGDGASGGDGGWNDPECRVTTCQGHLYQCGDCLDNDGDGKADSQDSDCLGPCDNNEGGFNTEIPGGNASPCSQECYFDQDTGAGNDDCYWDHRCDPYEPLEQNACNYANTCSNCDCDGWLAGQSNACLNYCLPLVPNGCDCFGCCELDAESGEFYFIGSPGCTLNNRSACSQCTPVPSCLNGCGPCELCLGRTELPPECLPEDRCPEGVQLCGMPEDDPCPVSYYCITGCCMPVVE